MQLFLVSAVWVLIARDSINFRKCPVFGSSLPAARVEVHVSPVSPFESSLFVAICLSGQQIASVAPEVAVETAREDLHTSLAKREL